MKIKNYTISLIFVSILVLISACTGKYEEYNRNINGATDEEMDRDQFRLRSYVITLQNNVIPVDVNTNQFVECLLGGNFGGYLADSNPGFNNGNFATYMPQENWRRVPFNDLLPVLMSNWRYVNEMSTDPVITNVATVIKILGMHRVTDIYGPIPYSKIGLDGQIQTPYDSQEEIYTQMLAELDMAITELTKRQSDDFTAQADRVYKGKVVNWIKLANSLKLRLAMRLADVKPELAKQKAEEVANHAIGTMAANADNAYLTLVTTNPFRVVMYEYNNGDSRVSGDITSYMNGFHDPRREKYFTTSAFVAPIQNGYLGMRTGITIPSSNNIKLYSNMNVTSSSPLMWMNAAESAFLKAEGALRGWNMGGSAKDFYNHGIQLSFDQWGATGAAQYMTDNTSTPDVYVDPMGANNYSGNISNIKIQWDESASFDANLERVITQKWIANFPLGIEAWSEYRRTGYPKLMQVAVNNSGGIVNSARMARRLSYPQIEYTDNATNVNAAVSNLLKGPDNMATDVWWAKKN